jgi:type II secretory pathway pseudopilin PulG
VRNKLTQRGDTIVEVLIAIAVVSSVLGMSYATMNRNLLTIRDNQERTEAVKLAQGQIESIKFAWNTNDPALIASVGSNEAFCMNGAVHRDFTGALGVEPDITLDDPTTYHAECSDLQGIYRRAVEYDSLADLYRIYVRWDRIGGRGLDNGRSQIIMVYKL